MVPDVTVISLRSNPNGDLVGELRWWPVPEAVFHLTLTPDGRIVEWRAVADEGGTLTARRLRAAPIGAMERAIRQTVGSPVILTIGPMQRRSFPDGILLGTSDEPAQTFTLPPPAWAADFAERPRTGSAGRSDKSYVALAAMYVRAIEAGEEHPVRAVALQMQLGDRTVRNYLFKARERGLLTSLGRGKAGGQLTDKAKEMLSGNDQAS